MVKLPPPIWALLYLIIAGVASWIYPWRQLVDLRATCLGITLVAIALTFFLWAFSLFRIEGTQINPTSETNKVLVIRGPYHFTRNPMYLALTILTLGIAFPVGALPMFFVPVAVFATANLGAYPLRGDGENAPAVRRRVSTHIQDRSVAGD